MTTSEFIALNREGDPRALALQARRYPDVDMAYALRQIQGWQTARRKLPSWAECGGVEYPPHLNMEQCSSEPTARYKQEVVGRWLEKCGEAVEQELPRPEAPDPQNPESETYNSKFKTQNSKFKTRMADLTGGFGVDFSFTSRCFARATYVERDAALCDVVRGNLPRLGVHNASVVCAEAGDFLEASEPLTMLFLDPARRDANGAKTVFLADCTPDVTALLPLLTAKSRFTVLKLSPMLDWHKAVGDLQGTVREVHVVSVGGECKELLLVLSESFADEPMRVVCADISPKPEADGRYVRSEFAYVIGGETSEVGGKAAVKPVDFSRAASLLSADAASAAVAAPPLYLYEPNASVMKAGCFAEIAAAYGVAGVDANSHLFLSENMTEDFPGRVFAVDAVTTMNKRALKQTLAGLAQANIAVRNFPLSVAELRKRLKLRDGGDRYIFATTAATVGHVLLLCRKAARDAQS